MKNKNLIILSIYLFALIATGVIYTAYNSAPDDVSNLRINSMAPAVVIKYANFLEVQPPKYYR